VWCPAATEQVLDLTDGKGADRGCECVGYQAHDPDGIEHPNMTMNNLRRAGERLDEGHPASPTRFSRSGAAG
jgi:hypothetical protein